MEWYQNYRNIINATAADASDGEEGFGDLCESIVEACRDVTESNKDDVTDEAADDLDEGLLNGFKKPVPISSFATKALDLSTEDEANTRVQDDYRKHLGRRLEVPYVYGMVDGNPQQFNATISEPFIVKVLETESNLITRWRGVNVLPKWRVAIVDGHGISLKTGWIDAPSYRVQRRAK